MIRGNQTVARNVRRLREERGMSLGELARRAGLAKGTLSKLELGEGNPTVDTLFAIAAALEVPATRLVSEHANPVYVQRQDEAEWVAWPSHASRFLDHVYGSGVIENYLLRIESPTMEDAEAAVSDPHPVGTLEHLYVISGKVRVGPVARTIDLVAGDFTRYPADRPHVYQSLDGRSLVYVVVSVPQNQPGTGQGRAHSTGTGLRPSEGRAQAR